MSFSRSHACSVCPSVAHIHARELKCSLGARKLVSSGIGKCECVANKYTAYRRKIFAFKFCPASSSATSSSAAHVWTPHGNWLQGEVEEATRPGTRNRVWPTAGRRRAHDTLPRLWQHEGRKDGLVLARWTRRRLFCQPRYLSMNIAPAAVTN